MKKNVMKMIGAALLSAIVALGSGCSPKKNYGTEYNYETDCQYSYYGSVTQWNKIQSDGNGQYILKNNYIYYYSAEKNTMTPLCNKPNCLHDMETDENRLSDCKAYAPAEIGGGDQRIQYYDGYIYYFVNDLEEISLYRVSKDGNKKDKIFTTDNEIPVSSWLIHRGYLYYVLQTNYYGEDKSTQVYRKATLKSAELSSNMSEKNAKIIFESDETYTVTSLYKLKAYKNYLCYTMDAHANDFESTDTLSMFRKLYSPMYLYNIETEQNSEIPVPEGYSKSTNVASVTFLKDKILLKLYDNVQDIQGNTPNGEYQLPIYSINYDLTDEKIWLDNVKQGKLVQSYDDYVIISDAFLQLLPHIYSSTVSDGDIVLNDLLAHTNVEIYSADAELLSYFVYPMNVMGNFNGFGPDGVNVEFEENDDSWSVYELNFDDVLHCNGEEVKLDLVSTRKYGTLNKD